MADAAAAAAAIAAAANQGEQKQVAAALALLQRLPPSDLETNLASFCKIAPHLSQGLEPYVTRPLRVVRDPKHNLHFIACEFNSDGDSHRSPWSNEYFPPLQGEHADGVYIPSQRLRRLEILFNEVFDAYKTSYYEGGVSSVYLWELEEGFGAVFLIRKETAGHQAREAAVWESIHVVEVRESVTEANLTDYRLTATVRASTLAPDRHRAESGVDAWESRQRTASVRRKTASDDQHLLEVGRMIEEVENSIHQHMEGVYAAKQRDILAACRSAEEPFEVLRPPAASARPP